MKLKIAAAALPVCVCLSLAWAADKPVADTLTSLPVPLAGAAFLLYGNPMKIDDFSLCKSTVKMNYYTARSGKVDAAVTWYTGHLAGFKHTKAYGSDRSQDIFFNGAGTLMVSITGNAAKQGENTDVYAVTYASVQPGASAKALAGLAVQNIDCR